MFQYFVHRRIQFYLDFVLNLVDVRDVAAGLLLAMQRGRIGEGYVLGGENFSLKKLLALIAVMSGQGTAHPGFSWHSPNCRRCGRMFRR